MKAKFQLADLRRYNEILIVAGMVLALGGVFSGLILNKTTWWGAALLVVGLILLGLFLAVNLREVKETGKRRSTQVRANLSLLAVAVLVIVVALNYIIQRHPVQKDMTSNQFYTLSPQTLDLLKNLKTDVNATMFITNKRQGALPEVGRARELLGEYAKHGSKFHVKIVDADRDVSEVKRFNVREYNVVVFESGENRKDVLQRDYLTYAYDGRRPTPKFQGEQAFTNALIRMSDTAPKTVYLIEGHGERELSNPQAMGLTNLKSLLEGSNYVVKTIKTVQEKAIPDDCVVLAALGPTKPFAPRETELIQQWLHKGGKFILCADPKTTTGLESLLSEFGLKLGHQVVLDKTSFAIPDLASVIPQYVSHPITEKLLEMKAFSIMPFCRVVSKTDPVLKGVTHSMLLQTTPEGWGETDLKSPNPTFGSGDLKGPAPMAYACEWIPEAASGAPADAKVRLAVFGTSSFLTNAMTGNGGGMDLAVNAFNWAALEEGKISIRPKEEENRSVNFTSAGGTFVQYLVIVFMPLAVLGVGAFLWYRRRLL